MIYCRWFTIQVRTLLLVVLSLIGMLGIFVSSAYYIQQSLFDARTEQTKRLVTSVVSMLDATAKMGKEKGWSRQETQEMAVNLIKNMGYNDKEYFFVNDLEGYIHYHPYPELHHTVAIGLKDAAGKPIIKGIVDLVTHKGEGVYGYLWPPTKPTPKQTYAKIFVPWGWVVGSGVIVDDIQNDIQAVERQLLVAAILISMFSVIFAYYVGRSISIPIIQLNATMRSIVDGDRDIEVPQLGRHDELGSMAETVQTFLENARRISLLEAEQKETDNLKSEFVSVVSHELRTPLTSIRGSLGLVAAGAAGTLPEKAKHLIGIAYNNCERLILLINDILDIDKIATGNMNFQLKQESVNKLVRLAVDANRPYADKFFVKYNYKSLEPDAHILTDSARYQQILTNFLSNAAKFSIGGSHVDIVSAVTGDWVRVSVQDHGLGIPEEFRGKIFKKFSQADSSATRKKGGTGLGLYISKQLAEQMGGRVGYESTAGVGTTFWIEFKVDAPNNGPKTETKTASAT